MTINNNHFLEYSPIPIPYRLQKIVDDIYEMFVSSGLMHREYPHVKLHATLLNSIKRQDDDLPELLVVKKRPRVSFDAYPIMQVSE